MFFAAAGDDEIEALMTMTFSGPSWGAYSIQTLGMLQCVPEKLTQVVCCFHDRSRPWTYKSPIPNRLKTTATLGTCVELKGFQRCNPLSLQSIQICKKWFGEGAWGWFGIGPIDSPSAPHEEAG